ncbi:MAG: L-ribulose-5-phosphate 3-epimerase [Enterobacteriaceae bacterium]
MYRPSPLHRLGLYEKALPASLTWPEKLQAAKELGFDFLEISVDESDERLARLDWSDKEIFSLRHLCEEVGLPLQSMCLSAHRRFPFGSADKAIRQKAAQVMQQAITLAYKLGVRTIQLAGYDVYYEPATQESHQRFIAGMRDAANMAAHAGVMLAMEIMDTPYLNSLSKFEILRRQVDSPWFMAYPDVGNIHGWNHDVCTELTLSHPHIVQIHLKETRPVSDDFPGQFRDLVPGEGNVDFHAIFATLHQLGSTVPLVLEMWAQDEQWRDNIVQAKAFIDTLNRAENLESSAGKAGL